jgi:fibrillarin-like pre-rRNA processing protein
VGVLMVKARSIDVSLKPSEAYEIVAEELKKQGLELLKKLDLTPYEKDHLAVMVTF